MEPDTTVDNYIECDENTPLFSVFDVDPDEFDSVDIDHLNLVMRSLNCLRRSGCNSLRDLLMMTVSGLKSLKHIGVKGVKNALAAIREYLAEPRIRISEEESRAANAAEIKVSARNAVESILLGRTCPSSDFNGNRPALLEEIKKSVKFDQGFYTCKFGHYPQFREDESEPVEWIILDEKDGKFLLVSKYALDEMPYEFIHTLADRKPVCGKNLWHACDLRKWLNSYFLWDAFSEEERKVIVNTFIDDFGTGSTTDRVFLLSETEAELYFSSYAERKCKTTEYCRERGAETDEDGNCRWWLRTPVPFLDTEEDIKWVEIVGNEGIVIYSVQNVEGRRGAVRPALWVDLKA